MKKITAIALTLVILACVLSGCGQSTLPSPENPVTLTMWHVYGSQTKSPLNTVIDEFNSTVGTQYGITVNVASVTSSSAIDKALSASAKDEPGAEKMPDLFTAYPRVAEIVGEENLIDWDEYFTEDELSLFHGDFLTEGYFDGKLKMLPIAKSVEAFYINKTLFDRFGDSCGVTLEDMSTFDGVFSAAREYYDFTGGKDFLQINDYYHYVYIGMKAHGSEFVRNGRLRVDDEAFRKIWIPLAKTAIYGGLCLEDGYAAARWKTAEVIANTGSTADVLYQPSQVIYPDNTTEPIEAVALPYPTFTPGVKDVVYRGGGLFALKNEDERKNYAAYIFAKWLTQKENNLAFVTTTGYLPVTDEAFEALFEDLGVIEKENYRSVYGAVDKMLGEYSFTALPLYSGASELQSSFEANVKTVLRSSHNQYRKRIEQGEDPTAVMDELIQASLDNLRALTDN